MLKPIFIALLSLLSLLGNGSDQLLVEPVKKGRDGNTGTIEKMIAASGSVAMEINLSRLGRTGSSAKETASSVLRFDVQRDSFFTVIVFNNELRGPLPSTMALVPQTDAALPGSLNASYGQLIVENTPPGSHYELVVRDGKSGFPFFNIEGHQYEYNADLKLLTIRDGRLLLSNEYAAELGLASQAGTYVGDIALMTSMRTIETSEIVDGEVKSDTLPAMRDPNMVAVPGPDVVVGDLNGLAQFGTASGNFVGLAVGTDSCNFGTVDLNWFALPNNDHPVIPQNMYRMSGGSDNTERFEQIGQSSVKHAFTALTNNLCQLGCNGVGGTRLGVGCSDPYSAGLNAGPGLGSRAWINPFTGFYPRGDSATPPNNHTGHSHTGPSHRILTEIEDLNTTLNPGATYYAEAQYVTPHEYAWCQANPGQCNMYNNVSYRRYNVTGTTGPFTFQPVGATVRQSPAIVAWTGATLAEIKPDPATDGIGMLGYKVTNPSPGVWHYEYAIYNQNLDRGIGSFSVPIGAGVTLNNIGFSAPPQHPGWTGDGTAGNAGFSSTPWATTQNNGTLTWATETFAQNPNANAIRWGTMYNFRFDSNRPPTSASATIGFYKNGSPITVGVMVPSGLAASVSVGGRVTTGTGQSVTRAAVTISSVGGAPRTVFTNTFGYYRIDNVTPGTTYTISVGAKRYTFTPQTLQINADLTNLNFTANP